MAQSVKYIPVSVFPVVYVVHSLYRRYKPRKLPTLTSLTMLELYVVAATPVLVRCLGFADAVDIIRDKDRGTILYAAGRLRNALKLDPNLRQSFKNLDATMSQSPAGREEQARLKWLREGDDRSGNIIQRVVWWYRHPLWSHDQSIWNGMAMLMLEEYKQKAGDTQPPVETLRRDWDLCVTYLTTVALFSRVEKWGEKAKKLLAASIPAAWLARFSGRPLLYLPMGGVQRLLLGVVLYADWASNAGLFLHIKRIRDKTTFAHLVTGVFGDLKFKETVPTDESSEMLFELFE
ncbi:hypothetical protein GSI_07909 [Ganoderma sinense ZZ0214-1]|uniref:Uncharacterized protein n=1 Tax=Ganoderma sinense ZZ0214-1 TaxID=1077348 RepID=A0A2G8S8Y7_9APHY|nr:hypothetical protein GSI_07909 [Ganoderma sinense ZZ0214-1]